MSTFDGIIREYPFICIDHFTKKPGVKAYLLSHAHTDHMVGLDSATEQVPRHPSYSRIYASDLTASILECMNYTGLHVMRMPLNQPLVVEGIKITCLYSNHCAGSVMFLIQGDQGCVLYTGDMRAEKTFLLDLLPILPPLHTVYLDTSFCHSDYTYLPSKQASLDALVSFISSQKPSCCFQLNIGLLGCELWIPLSLILKTPVHVSPNRFALYSLLAQEYNIKLTRHPHEARLHICDDCTFCQSHAHLPSTLRWRSKLITSSPPFSLIEYQGNTCYLLYSMHSSLEEIKECIKAFAPHHVIPCVVQSPSTFTSIMNILMPLLRKDNITRMPPLPTDTNPPSHSLISTHKTTDTSSHPPVSTPLKSSLSIEQQTLIQDIMADLEHGWSEDESSTNEPMSEKEVCIPKDQNQQIRMERIHSIAHTWRHTNSGPYLKCIP